MKGALFLLLCLSAIEGGCPTDQKERPAPQKRAPLPIRPIHRFAITRNEDLAFDTQTGQLCKTWNWEPTIPPPKPNERGVSPQRFPGEFTPTCVSLYEKYQTGTNPNDSLGLFEDEETDQPAPKSGPN